MHKEKITNVIANLLIGLFAILIGIKNIPLAIGFSLFIILNQLDAIEYKTSDK